MSMSHWSLYVNRSSQVLRDNLAKILLMQGADAPSRAPRSLFTFNTPQDISQFATGSDSDIGGLSTVHFDFIQDESVNGPIGRMNRPTPSPSSKDGPQPPMGTARFWGTMSLRIPSTPAANKPRITRSGYAGFRNKARPSLFGNITEDLSSHDYLALRLRPSGNPITRTSYFVNIQTEDDLGLGIGGLGGGMEVWQHRLMFKNQDVPEEELLGVKDGGWEELYIPFNNFVLTHAGEIVDSPSSSTPSDSASHSSDPDTSPDSYQQPSSPSFQSLQSKPTIRREKVKSIGISILGGNSGIEGRYELGIDEIRAVNDEDVRRDSEIIALATRYHSLEMKIAVEGCCHGALDAIYRQIATLEQRNNYKVDLLLICGDFQAIRNPRDLQCMAVPDKYKQLGEFHKYYTGERVAPVLTIVIGGNHEASNYFWELYHGGWIAPNMYFMGHAGCVQVNGVRIAGASGIFKAHDFRKGHYERLPYDHGTMRSIYHIREYSVRRLSLLSSPDIFLSHDWPQSIEQHGDVRDLLRRKRFFTEDVNTGRLGSPPLMGLLRTLQPKWWFSAHLHTRFEATVVHGVLGVPSGDPGAPVTAVTAEGTNPDEIVIDDEDEGGEGGEEGKIENGNAGPSSAPPLNPDEIKLDDEEEEVAPPPLPPPAPTVTNFLALDKCLPGRQFLEVIDIPTPSDNDISSSSTSASASVPEAYAKPTLTYDPEWLAITRAFDPYFSLRAQQQPFPEEAEARDMVAKELGWVEGNLNGGVGGGEKGRGSGNGRSKPVEECQQFVMTAPGPGAEGGQARQQPPAYRNPQTDAFCAMLGLQCKINAG